MFTNKSQARNVLPVIRWLSGPARKIFEVVCEAQMLFYFEIWRIDLPARAFLEMRKRLVELYPRQFIFEPDHFFWRKRRRIVERPDRQVDCL